MRKTIWLVLLLVILYFGFKYYQESTPKTPKTKTDFIYQVFFPNIKKDPNMLDCTKVYPINRHTTENVTPEFIIQKLIEGLTQQEITDGFVTTVPKECKLNFIQIKNEKAIIDFKPFHIAGSCATAAFTAQVKETVLAMPQVREVQITIQGKSEGILQP